MSLPAKFTASDKRALVSFRNLLWAVLYIALLVASAWALVALFYGDWSILGYLVSGTFIALWTALSVYVHTRIEGIEHDQPD